MPPKAEASPLPAKQQPEKTGSNDGVKLINLMKVQMRDSVRKSIESLKQKPFDNKDGSVDKPRDSNTKS